MRVFKHFLVALASLSTFLGGCNQSSTPSQTYDGREFDISEKQDNSLKAKSEKDGNYYHLTISGEGKGIDYQSKTSVPWNPIIKKINKVVINEGITHIGDYYFNSLAMDYLILPRTVLSVGDHSFNPSTVIYTFGGELTNLTSNVYYYSETKPTEYGKYFYMEDGVPHVWQKTSFLFIGNSFTYRAGTESDPQVPKFFNKIASSLNQETEIDYVVKGSHTLTKFANPKDECGSIVEAKLTTKKYDYVILQEQSTTPINNYNTFLNAVKTLKTRIDQTQTNCKTVLYETWGSPTGIEGTTFKTVGEMEAALRTAYENAAKETECLLNYIGKAFTDVYENHKDINIYADDNRHQNEYGAYLSAACHVRALFKVNVTNSTEYCGLDQNSCKTLLSVANKTN